MVDAVEEEEKAIKNNQFKEKIEKFKMYLYIG
jgi:hypothetical protein